MTLTELLPLVSDLSLPEKEQLWDELRQEISSARRKKDSEWLDELDRRISGYYDGSIRTYSQEEVDAILDGDTETVSSWRNLNIHLDI